MLRNGGFALKTKGKAFFYHIIPLFLGKPVYKLLKVAWDCQVLIILSTTFFLVPIEDKLPKLYKNFLAFISCLCPILSNDDGLNWGTVSYSTLH